MRSSNPPVFSTSSHRSVKSFFGRRRPVSTMATVLAE
jgi:hypothetical protein